MKTQNKKLLAIMAVSAIMNLPCMGSRYDSRHYGRNDIGYYGLDRLRIGRGTGRYSTW